MRDATTPVRLMVWNLCRGGRGTAAGDTLDQMTDLVAEVSPDILCCTETYGATQRLVAGLGGAYRGYPLAAAGTDDNLSVVTRLPVTARLPYPEGRTVDSYNLGGVLVGLPDGGELAVFDTWLRYDVAIADALERTAAEIAAGRERSRTDGELALLELPQLANIEEILTEHLPAAVPEETPVVLAGGLNTESHLDADAADGPDDEPAELRRYRREVKPRWQVTRRLEKAGFVDAYRSVWPDPRRWPGATFDPLNPAQRLPHRIDYVFAGGPGVSVTGARTYGTRLPMHGPGPFYSDHAALVVDLAVRSLSG